MKIIKAEETLGDRTVLPAARYPSGAVFIEAVTEPAKVVNYHNMAHVNEDLMLGDSKGYLSAFYPERKVVRQYAPVNEGGNYPLGWALHHYVGEGEQIPLFVDNDTNIDARPHIEEFTGTKGSRVGNMTMLGVAELDAQRQGKTLADDYSTSAHSLSPHSSKLVKKLTGQDVPVTNDWDFQERLDHVDYADTMLEPGWQVSLVPDEDVKLGRSIVRAAVKNASLSKQFDAHNYEQPQLPGM